MIPPHTKVNSLFCVPQREEGYLLLWGDFLLLSGKRGRRNKELTEK
jgi:hypothetical protein